MFTSRYGIFLVFVLAILVVAIILLGVQLAIEPDADDFVQGDPVMQEEESVLPVYISGLEYIVIPEGTGVPPRYWLSPDELLYSFTRVDWNGWGYYLIPDEDPYVRQPTLNSEG